MHTLELLVYAIFVGFIFGIIVRHTSILQHLWYYSTSSTYRSMVRAAKKFAKYGSPYNRDNILSSYTNLKD